MNYQRLLACCNLTGAAMHPEMFTKSYIVNQVWSLPWQATLPCEDPVRRPAITGINNNNYSHYMHFDNVNPS